MKVLTIMLIGFGLWCSGTSLLAAYTTERALQIAESQCIRNYIAVGVERADIIVNRGTCAIRK